MQESNDRNILRVPIAGFALVIFLLLAAGFIGVRNSQSIQSSAARLVGEQILNNGLIDEIQREQETLNTVYYVLRGGLETAERDKVMRALNATDQAIDRIIASAKNQPDAKLWNDLSSATDAFSSEARQLMMKQSGATAALLKRNDDVVALIGKLITAGNERSSKAQLEIEAQSRELVNQSTFLLGTALILALACAVLTIRMTAELFRKMEWQAGELSRVSWHMVENQESAARRFSHELHDELGQSLTAVKANLVAMRNSADRSDERLRDCLQVVDESIRNVRELSQLMRPTILDDFGLDAGLRWLCEGFAQRTGIEVEYASPATAGGEPERLPDDTETQLFRISQEALTNVARHSGASRVKISLSTDETTARLSIADNGKGLGPARTSYPGGAPDFDTAPSGGLGMIGMRARARSAGGELRIGSPAGGGLLLEAWVPVKRLVP